MTGKNTRSLWAQLGDLGSEAGVRRNSRFAIVVAFLVGTLIALGYAFVRFDDPRVANVVPFGLIGGAVVAIACARALRPPDSLTGSRQKALSGFRVSILLIGGVVFLAGAVVGSVALALTGIPFIALAFGLALVRRL